MEGQEAEVRNQRSAISPLNGAAHSRQKWNGTPHWLIGSCFILIIASIGGAVWWFGGFGILPHSPPLRRAALLQEVNKARTARDDGSFTKACWILEDEHHLGGLPLEVVIEVLGRPDIDESKTYWYVQWDCRSTYFKVWLTDEGQIIYAHSGRK